MNKPTIISVTHDDGEHSHYALVDSDSGVKLWSENPEECKAQGYPVESERARYKDLVEAAKIITPEKFRQLAAWIDLHDNTGDDEVQCDLRKMADALEAALNNLKH